MSARELFAVEGVPLLQNRTYRTRAEALASPVGDVVLVQEEQTGLVFNSAFDPARLTYDREYQNEQAHSEVFRQHLSDICAILDRHFRSKSIVEVGCGKGYFLEQLLARGYRVSGIDPAYDGDNPNIIKAPFERSLGLSSEAIVLRHVLEHIQDPLEFLRGMRDANGGRGDIYIEVPCLDWICRKRAWFDVFYEHVNYFRLGDLDRMFATVKECGRLFGDQYIYVIADLASLRDPIAGRADAVRFPTDFLERLNRLSSPADRAHRRAVWGAASKGVIFSLHMQRTGVTLDLAIDINPAKHGRYLPVTGLEVYAPEDAVPVLDEGDIVFIMNSNYLEEIKNQSHHKFRYERVDDD